MQAHDLPTISTLWSGNPFKTLVSFHFRVPFHMKLHFMVSSKPRRSHPTNPCRVFGSRVEPWHAILNSSLHAQLSSSVTLSLPFLVVKGDKGGYQEDVGGTKGQYVVNGSEAGNGKSEGENGCIKFRVDTSCLLVGNETTEQT